MSEELTTQPTNLPSSQQKQGKSSIAFSSRGLQLTSLDDAYRFAQYASIAPGFVPRGFENKPELILAALQMGAELGLPPIVSINSIAIINGRPSLYGDAPLAIVEQSGLLEDMDEHIIGTKGKDDYGYSCTVKRKGRSKSSTEVFTVSSAKAAGLWGKSGPWSQYPERMLKARARGFALRDNFADVLKGFYSDAEADDVIDIGASSAYHHSGSDAPEQLQTPTPTSAPDKLPDAPSAKSDFDD